MSRPVDLGKPPATFWAVYGRQQGYRKILLYNVTALYHDDSSYVDFSAFAMRNFNMTYELYPWFVPNKWAYSQKN